VIACVASALLAIAAIAGPAVRATPASPHRSASGPLRFDGRLAAAGDRLCKSLHVSARSVTELSCEALQRTVKSGPYPFLWQLTQVISATLIAGSHAPRSARQQYASQVYASFHHYAHPSFANGLGAAVGGGLRYYDDNAWAGMDLIEAYDESGERQLLQAAAGVLTFQRTGEWRPGGPPDQQMYPGGIYWNVNLRFRALNATAGTAQLALELYADTHARADLELGKQEYDWVRQTLGTPGGMYRERVDPGGTIAGSGTDNGNGFMVGVGVLLHQATHQKQYLNQAVQTTKASLKHFKMPVLESTCPAYNASYFSNLARLHKVDKLSSISKALDGYATWVAQHINPHTGVFKSPHYHCHPPCPQAGAAGTLSLRAMG
jgi:Glycosyl hydrolase family 76